MISGTYIWGLTNMTKQDNKLLKPTTFPQFFADFFPAYFCQCLQTLCSQSKNNKKLFFVSDCGAGCNEMETRPESHAFTFEKWFFISLFQSEKKNIKLDTILNLKSLPLSHERVKSRAGTKNWLHSFCWFIKSFA